VENRPVKMRPLHPSAPPPPVDPRGPTGEHYPAGAIREQVDRALPDPGDRAVADASPAGLAAAIRGLTEATQILADRLDDLHAQLRAR
jgi:hypothetical protein